MRSLIAGLIIVAACGGGSDEGAILTVRAPDGPLAADRLELVLASAATIVDVDDQRAAPTELRELAARYYRQRSTAGSVDGVAELDGFVVRIEPNAEASTDEQFIPFVIAHERVDGGLRVTGIGAVLDASGEPAPIAIVAGKTEAYFVEMIAVNEASGDAAIAPLESLAVSCALGQGTYRSGLAWQPPAGPQLRLLLPDLALDAAATDASARPLDLDCDGAEALVDDCDDLRAEFNDAAAEACDGRDTDCDGEQLELLPCTAPAGSCGAGTPEGVATCSDRGTPTEGTCAATPQCQCANGSPGPCTKCILAFTKIDESHQRPCAPAVGGLELAGCSLATPCTIQVVANPGSPWEALVGKEDGVFGLELTGVTETFFVKVKPLEPDFSAAAASSVGEVYLLIDDGTSSRQLGIDLQLTGAGPNEACLITNSVSQMLCS